MRSQNHTDVTMYIFKVCADFHRGVEGLNIQTTVLTRSSSIVYTLKIYKNLRFTWGGQWCITASIPTNIEFHMYVFVSRCLRLYKVQNVLVYIPPTITYIYGFKKHLFMLISSTTTKSVNVAWVGMDGIYILPASMPTWPCGCGRALFRIIYLIFLISLWTPCSIDNHKNSYKLIDIQEWTLLTATN